MPSTYDVAGILPEKCGCGAQFNVAHAMQCMVGGFRGLMHNEVQYVFYDSFKQAGYKDVALELIMHETAESSNHALYCMCHVELGSTTTFLCSLTGSAIS